jgi:hypothetical protein
MNDEELSEARERLEKMGMAELTGLSNEQLRAGLQMLGESFRDNAPVSAGEAAKTILDGVREARWRILVGEDAAVLDRLVREDPEGAYEQAFMDRLRAEADWALGV